MIFSDLFRPLSDSGISQLGAAKQSWRRLLRRGRDGLRYYDVGHGLARASRHHLARRAQIAFAPRVSKEIRN